MWMERKMPIKFIKMFEFFLKKTISMNKHSKNRMDSLLIWENGAENTFGNSLKIH